MIKIYEDNVLWVLVSLLCFVLIVLGSVKICQMISETWCNSRDSRLVFIDAEGDIEVFDPEPTIQVRRTIKQSYSNLAPPLYTTISKATTFSTYELPPPYPIDYI